MGNLTNGCFNIFSIVSLRTLNEWGLQFQYWDHVCKDGELLDCPFTCKFWVDSRFSLRPADANIKHKVSGFGSGGDMAQNYFVLYNSDTLGLTIFPSKFDTLLL